MINNSEKTHYFISSDRKFSISIYANSNQAELYGRQQSSLQDLAKAIYEIKQIIHKSIKCYVEFCSTKDMFCSFKIEGDTVDKIFEEIIQQFLI